MSAFMIRTRTFALISIITVASFLPAAGLAGAGDGQRSVELEVDARDVAREIVHVSLTMTAEPVLVFPVWVPGHHERSDFVRDIAGLTISAGQRAVVWHRDPLQINAIHLELPEGVGELRLRYDVLVDGGMVSPKLACLDWSSMVWYPADADPRRIVVQARMQIPEEWRIGTALQVASSNGSSFTFEPVTLDRLVDSPVLAAAHLVEIPLGSETEPAHWLVLATDDEGSLHVSEAQLEGLHRLVDEAHQLFGARPYRSYRFLFALSDDIKPGALEHHECSLNRGPGRVFLDDAVFKAWISMLPHEFVHSWNGKYRRPSGQLVWDFHQDRDTSLLWVYESLTEYLAWVLTARSGLVPVAEMRDFMAASAQVMGNHTGRTWRPLLDMTVTSRLRRGLPDSWRFWKRGNWDYYLEGPLVWLEVDGIVRETSQGQRALDDFCRAFFGGQDGAPAVEPYALADLIGALDAVAPFDWQDFFERRVGRVRPEAPSAGLQRCGWRLVTRPTRSDGLRMLEDGWFSAELHDASIGLLITGDGQIRDVVPGSPSDLAGVAPGSTLIAVNGRRFSAQRLRDAIAATASGRQLHLLVEKGEFFTQHDLDYDGGARYPGLEPIPGRPDLLSAILAPAVSSETR